MSPFLSQATSTFATAPETPNQSWQVHPETGCIQFKYCPPAPTCGPTANVVSGSGSSGTGTGFTGGFSFDNEMGDGLEHDNGIGGGDAIIPFRYSGNLETETVDQDESVPGELCVST